jgi:hypothetical protein
VKAICVSSAAVIRGGAVVLFSARDSSKANSSFTQAELDDLIIDSEKTDGPTMRQVSKSFPKQPTTYNIMNRGGIFAFFRFTATPRWLISVGQVDRRKG